MAASKSPARKYAINLALQGGGSHGAFTWGVLDRLLAEDDLEIAAISGASAGAVNTVALASGLATGGPAQARQTLDQLWNRIGDLGNLSLFQRGPLDRLLGSWDVQYSPAFMAYDMLSRLVPPSVLNPLNVNPLRDILGDLVDWQALRRCAGPKLFVSATTVRSGRIRVFRNEEVTLDAVLASTCLPMIHQTMMIDGEAYWDGGYLGNPALFPLAYESPCADILLIQINPFEHEHMPQTSVEIYNRLNEIAFNSSLLAELRAIAFVGRLVEQKAVDTKKYRKLNLHAIGGDMAFAALGAASKYNAELEFLLHLKQEGIEATERWLADHRKDIGKRSSLDVAALLDTAA
jgi:NTE family protein